MLDNFQVNSGKNKTRPHPTRRVRTRYSESEETTLKFITLSSIISFNVLIFLRKQLNGLRVDWKSFSKIEYIV